MFRAVRPFLDKVPYATLFGYNAVLQSVFSAPSRKEAIVVELPGAAPLSYTYGDLQNDVLSMANVVTCRREALAAARGLPPLSWVQSPRPEGVRGLFSDDAGARLSCDVMPDDGTHNTAIIGDASYAFVVSLLAAWSLNQMAVPLSAAQRYEGELAYILDHSRARQVMGDAALLRERFPPPFAACTVRDVSPPAARPPGPNTHEVDTMYDVDALLAQLRAGRARRADAAPLRAELLGAERPDASPTRTATDVMAKWEREEAAAAARDGEWRRRKVYEQFRARGAVTEAEDGSGLYFDTDHLDALNAVHRRWAEASHTRPSKHDDCVMIYTSGTTARPKGAVHTHASVWNMVRVLQSAWAWSAEDTVLHMLPMHHIHGLVNILLCSLASNARCVLTRFDDPIRIAQRMERGDITLVMAVPTLYSKMIAAIQDRMSPVEKIGFRNVVSQSVRLMVSGSAALPVPTLDQFREISGHTLLERYGMTEIGMALSQPLHPVERRIPGTVGHPLQTVRPFVHKTVESPPGEEGKAYDHVGQLAIASDSLFDRYWSNPQATRRELVMCGDGGRYFDTGDTVGVRGQPNAASAVFTILGRTSVDIIKSRGYKLSALEIEAALLSRKDLFFEVAVVGCRDAVQGEMVVAIVAPQPAARETWKLPKDFTCIETPELNTELKKVAREILAYYKSPERFLLVPEVPRNPTGKVNKKNLKEQLNLA